jgi:recombination protein RecT
MSTTQNGTGAKPGLAERVGQSLEATDQPKAPTVYQMIERQQAEIERALPAHLKSSAPAFVRQAITLLKQSEALRKCDTMSILGALMQASHLGLELGPLQLAYVVPRGGKACLDIGYRGYIELGYRSGVLSDITAESVHDNDEFSFDRARGEISHSWDLKKERGVAYAYYAIANFKGGGRAFVVLSTFEVEKFRARSAMPNSPAWRKDYDAMGKKTAIRRLEPYMPKATEVGQAAALSAAFSLDGSVSSGSNIDDLQVEYPESNIGDYIDAEEIPADDNGEVIDGSVPLTADTQ